MKQNLIILITFLFLASCASTTVNDEATKRQELQQYKQEMHDLKIKVDALEKELSNTAEVDVVNVKVTELSNQLFEHFIEVTGTAEAEQDVNVSPESAGIIEQVLITEGMSVKKGQVLGKLKTDALERSLDEMEVQLALATTTFDRQKNLWDQNIGSELQFLQAKANKESMIKRIDGIKAQIEMAVVKSPINGIVDIVYQKKGQIGSPQIPFAKVMNMSKMKIYADVAESYLTKINKGDNITAFFPALNKEIKVPIYRIGNTINPNNRTFRVRVNINNKDLSIKPNLISVIKIRDYVAEDAIVVPALLVKDDFKGQFTYIVDPSTGKAAKKVYVKTGISNNNMTEVTEGLTAGMKIISEGYSQIVDGTSIQF